MVTCGFLTLRNGLNRGFRDNSHRGIILESICSKCLKISPFWPSARRPERPNEIVSKYHPRFDVVLGCTILINFNQKAFLVIYYRPPGYVCPPSPTCDAWEWSPADYMHSHPNSKVVIRDSRTVTSVVSSSRNYFKRIIFFISSRNFRIFF